MKVMLRRLYGHSTAAEWCVAHLGREPWCCCRIPNFNPPLLALRGYDEGLPAGERGTNYEALSSTNSLNFDFRTGASAVVSPWPVVNSSLAAAGGWMSLSSPLKACSPPRYRINYAWAVWSRSDVAL